VEFSYSEYSQLSKNLVRFERDREARMRKEFKPTRFGDTLRVFRKRFGRMTLARLAGEVTKVAGIRVSATALHYLETGRYKRPPARETVRGIARALSLSPSESQQLLELAGHGVVSEPLHERAMESIGSVLQIAESQDAEIFIRHVEASADRFARSLSARNEDVRIALIPIAGWQARVLAAEIVERMLVPALYEAIRAGVGEVILVIAPGTASEWTLREKFKGLVIRTVDQDQPSGLGRALLVGRPANYFGPIAVLLPDEVDPSGEALADLAQQYRALHKAVIGVNPSPAEKEKHEILRYYGIAVLKPRRIAGHSSRLRELQVPLIEKPQEPRAFPPFSKKIAGRYILTPEIFDTLELTGPELTAALNEHWKTLYAHELRKDLVALSPYQGIIDVISSIHFRV
jgi:hypothetical protein